MLFLQGGASLQFSMVPMNLLPAGRTADYLLTGVWAQKAVKEAKILGGKVHIAASSEATNFDRIPQAERDHVLAEPGLRAPHDQQHDLRHPVARASPRCRPACRSWPTPRATCTAGRSTCGSTGSIYAGAQKNLGPSGVVLVIIRKDLVEAGPKTLPTMLQYRTFAAEKLALQHAADASAST